MDESVASILQWLVPAAVVFGVTAISLAILVWAVRRARHSPRARAAAEQVRANSGITLVRLDDAVLDLELEVGLSGALYGGDAPTSLRRARLSAQRVRDDSFAQFEAIGDPAIHPAEIKKVALRIDANATAALSTIARARIEHADWMAANVSAQDQVAAAKTRLQELRESMGDPVALVASLSSRFAEEEWHSASQAARGALTALDDAQKHLNEAAACAADPSRTALAELAAAERSLRAAQSDARALDEAHRLVIQAAQAVPDELASARTAVRQAIVTREHLAPADADRLGSEIRACEAELDTIETDAARRPTRAVDRIARVRDRLDLAVGDANTAQQRLRGARTALPGTLASARNALAQAEASISHTPAGAGADARSRLIAAQAALASARQVTDPVAALDAARRARLHAEDATALAHYAHAQTRRRTQ